MSDRIRGVIAEFESPSALLKAAAMLRDAGYKKFDCHSPFPVHGMDEAMGLKRSPLGWLVGLSALIGTSGALALQWWTSSVDYPLIISGKPFFSYPAYVPVTFALGVLLAAITALVGMLALNGLPRFHHPVFNSKSIYKASDDAFLISIEAADRQFDEEKTAALLESVGGKELEVLLADVE